jgi:hypothetical protein
LFWFGLVWARFFEAEKEAKEAKEAVKKLQTRVAPI